MASLEQIRVLTVSETPINIQLDQLPKKPIQIIGFKLEAIKTPPSSSLTEPSKRRSSSTFTFTKET